MISQPGRCERKDTPSYCCIGLKYPERRFGLVEVMSIRGQASIWSFRAAHFVPRLLGCLSWPLSCWQGNPCPKMMMWILLLSWMFLWGPDTSINLPFQAGKANFWETIGNYRIRQLCRVTYLPNVQLYYTLEPPCVKIWKRAGSWMTKVPWTLTTISFSLIG